MKIFTVFVVVSTDVIEAQLSNNIEKSDHYQNKYIEKSYPGKIKIYNTKICIILFS